MRHHVVGLVGIAAFYAGERGFGERGLDAEDGGGGRRWPWSAVPPVSVDNSGDVGGVLGRICSLLVSVLR